MRLPKCCKLGFVLVSALLLFLSSAVAQTRYTVINLGTLGGTFSDTGGVNNQGQAVGGATLTDDTTIHAFLWKNGLMADLGTLGGPNSFANGLSENTGAVGVADVSTLPGNPDLCFSEFVDSTNQCHAFLWQNGVMTDLGTLGGNSSSVGGIGANDKGQVVGTSETADFDLNNPPYQIPHAFLWQGGTMTDLGTFGGPTSGAGCVNDKGQVVGRADNTSSDIRAFLWENGVMSDLGTLGGELSSAIAINNQGQVVGVSTLSGETFIAHAFLWEGGLMTDLGTVPGDVHSFATDINSKGQVVGVSFDENGNFHGFLWQNGVLIDVDTLIPDGSNLQVVAAYQINDRGQIVGTAVDKSSGQVCAYLATPSPGKADGVGATLATAGGASKKPEFALQENVRKVLRQQLRQLGLGRFEPASGRPFSR